MLYLLGMEERVHFKYELLILSQPLASGNATKLLRLPEDVKSVLQLSNFQWDSTSHVVDGGSTKLALTFKTHGDTFKNWPARAAAPSLEPGAG